MTVSTALRRSVLIEAIQDIKTFHGDMDDSEVISLYTLMKKKMEKMKERNETLSKKR